MGVVFYALREDVCRCVGQFFQAGALTRATESCQTVYHQGFLLLNSQEDLRRYSQGLFCKHKVKIFSFIEKVSWSPMWVTKYEHCLKRVTWG